MMSVANTIELRISLDALKITAPGVCDVLLQTPEYVLHINNGVINKLTNSDSQTTERHRIDANTEITHRDNRRDERKRDSRKTDYRCSEIPQKEEEHNGNQEASFEQGLLNIVDRPFNECGLLKGLRFDRDVGGKRPAESGEGNFDLPRDFNGVCVGLFLDCRDNIRMHVEASVATLQCGTKLHRGDVLHKDWRSVPDGDGRVCEVFQRIHAASCTDQVLLGWPLKKAT